MKKHILTIIACMTAVSAFAFDFDKNKIEINANIKSEIKTVLTQNINTDIKKDYKYHVKGSKQNPDNKIIKLIREQMQIALQEIKRNTKFRKNIFTRSFVEEQEIQKQRYENMLKWDVPSQIYEYIERNFDLNKIQNLLAVCTHHDQTIIEVRFNYLSNYVIVYFDYKDKSIKHIIN